MGASTASNTLSLGGTTWNATAVNFENATLALAAGPAGFVTYGAIGGTDADLPDYLAGQYRRRE